MQFDRTSPCSRQPISHPCWRLAALTFTGSLAFTASVADAQTWTGPYVSGVAGWGKTTGHGEKLEFDTNRDGSYGETVKTGSGSDYFSPGFCRGTAQGTAPADGCHKDRGQGGLGLRVGYDWQSEDFVYGVVADVTGMKMRDSVSAFSTYPDSYTFSRKTDTVTALRGRAGYAHDGWLMYGTAGLAWAKIDRTFTTSNAFNSFSATKGKDGHGYQIGLGVEKVVSGNWAVGLEYLHTSLRDRGVSVLAGPSANTFASNPFLMTNATGTNIRRGDDDFKNDAVVVTVTYRFGAM